jgi:hypothetical protein
MADKILCPKCGSNYTLVQTRDFHVTEEGLPDMPTVDYYLFCSECDYEPDGDVISQVIEAGLLEEVL